MGLNNSCYPCTKETSPTTTEKECNRCGDLRSYNAEDKTCNFVKCPDNLVYGKGHYRDQSSILGCYECSDTYYVYETTKEECDKCPNRTYDGKYCNP